MLSNSIIIGMLVTITACFFAPVIMLFWLLIRRHAKRMIYMLLFGIIGRVLVVFVQLMIKRVLEEFESFNNLNGIIKILANDLIYMIIIIAVMIGLLYLLKPDGLTYNRVITISVGFSGVGILIGTGMTYLIKIANALSVKSGEIYNNYTKERADKIIESLSEESIIKCIFDAIASITIMMLFATVLVALLYALANNQMLKITLICSTTILVQKVLIDICNYYSKEVLGIILNIIVLAMSIFVLLLFQKKEKEMMIKPLSMINKENQL